jgi:hypothetical protein
MRRCTRQQVYHAGRSHLHGSSQTAGPPNPADLLTVRAKPSILSRPRPSRLWALAPSCLLPGSPPPATGDGYSFFNQHRQRYFVRGIRRCRPKFKVSGSPCISSDWLPPSLDSLHTDSSQQQLHLGSRRIRAVPYQSPTMIDREFNFAWSTRIQELSKEHRERSSVSETIFTLRTPVVLPPLLKLLGTYLLRFTSKPNLERININTTAADAPTVSIVPNI